MSIVSTACTYDCPDACVLLVEAGEAGITIRGDRDHPVTRGFVCQRVRRHVARLSDPGRITRPQIKRKSGWQALDWDDALDLAAGKLGAALGESGPASVVLVTGGGSLGLRKELVGHFFHSLGPVTTVSGGVCDEAGKRAQVLDFGRRGGHDYTDMQNSRTVVLWGKNPVETSVHLVPFIQEARSRGAEVVLIEVMPTPSAAYADRVIRLAPAADGFLALAVLRWLHDHQKLDQQAIHRCENFPDFERMLLSDGMTVELLARRADVSVSDVEYLAGLYSGHRPVATWVGFGLQRRRFGGRNLRCIDALCALSGNLGVPGGGANFGPGRTRGLDRSMLAQPTGRSIAAPTLGRDLAALRDPKACFVYVQGTNPVCQFAGSRDVAAALEGAGFTVVADAFLTDTAACADLILPTTLMFEEDADVVGSFGHHHVARVRKVVEPPDGVREDVWIVGQLNRRLGRSEDPWLADPKSAVEKMSRSWFGDSTEPYVKSHVQEPVPFAERFSTPSGKMNLVTDPPAEAPARDGFPLVFLTPKTRRHQHSQIRPDEQEQPPGCRVHPEALGMSGVADGARARVVSPLGGLEVRVIFDPGLRRDVCVVNSGGWLQFQRSVNALVAAHSTDLGECTAFYDQRVRIESCAP